MRKNVFFKSKSEGNNAETFQATEIEKKTFIIVTGNLFLGLQKDKIKEIENFILRTILLFEVEDKFNIIFAHKKKRAKL